MTHLVIGLGQIGSAIQQVLKCDAYDSYKNITDVQDSYDTLHVCIPYSDDFMTEIRNYQKKFNSSLIIIHGTVPIGTALQLDAVSSPVRGVHPHLYEGIMTFIKYFGGAKAASAAAIFHELGIEVYVHSDSRTIEALKLWDTTVYGFNIVLEKAIYEYCKDNNLDFNILYSHSNRTYNEGYAALGMSQFAKYNLTHKDGKIGGHCVVNNCDLLDSWVADLIKAKNNSL